MAPSLFFPALNGVSLEDHEKQIVAGESKPAYPLVMTNVAIENGHRNSGFTHEKW